MFAFAMVVGVGDFLTAVAVLSVWARQFVLKLVADRPKLFHGAVRIVDGLAGVTIVALAASTMTG